MDIDIILNKTLLNKDYIKSILGSTLKNED